MNEAEFKALRDLPDKKITGDIVFRPTVPSGGNLVFDDIQVENSAGWPVLLNGTYKPGIPTVIFNFYIRSQGAICRVCVNGNSHEGAGRTHKHELQSEEDQRRNLPFAIPRPELDGKSPREIWNWLLKSANINHTGVFHDP